MTENKTTASHSRENRIHFIAIGGAAMHNLAIALHQKGFSITGSDDEINEPSRSRLKSCGLLPEQSGWFPEKITTDLDAVILGMHARADNPELIKAQESGIRIYSYPEYLYEFSKNKKRVVIGGSHGKTSITAMIMHVLKSGGLDFDYMVGSKLEGFETMVRLTEKAPVIILEGDEYLASPIDRRPKFHLYHADIALLSGIAWDHINVFPTFENYVQQFQFFADQVPPNGTLVYCEQDAEVQRVAEISRSLCPKIPYGIPEYEIIHGITFLKFSDGKKKIRTELKVFGEHNLMNIEGARNVCNLLGVSKQKFFEAIGTFKGAARRLELLAKNETVSVYKDFAHSPSKLKATTDAVKQQYPGRKIIACMELHTFSSLNDNFLEQYKGSMNRADEAIVYFNPRTIEHKKLSAITEEQVRNAFGNSNLKVITDSVLLKEYLLNMNLKNSVLVMMSSGTFDGLDMESLSQNITGRTYSEV
ncbi:MAG: Mur ligase family protein [Bacteroidetes bacterium]|nr:Mur ligase family protein [Bacteroidota bacterium]